MKRFLEWYLDIPAAGPGQGTAWNLTVRPPWPDWLPLWGVLLLAVFGVAYVVWIYHRDANSISRPMRGLLVALRLSTIAVVLLFLAELTLTVDRTGLPVIVVMVDDSASMSLEDRYPNRSLAAGVAALLKEVRLKEPQRINLAKAALTRNNGRLLRNLASEHKLRVYRFSDTARVMGQGDYLNDDGIDEISELLTRLEATGDETRPGPAVRKVLDDLRGNPPSAIVLLTDGITSTNDADKLTGVTDLARSSLVPIFVVGIGSEEPSRDLQLYDTLVDEVAFVGDPVIFSANIKAYEFKGETVTIRLIDDRTGVVLATKKLSAGEDGQAVRVELPYTPPTKGEFDYKLEAKPLPNESNVTDNVETRHVSVREDRIRVLLADSGPRYEFRYLKQLLERDKTVELHTVLQEADVEYAQEDETALDHFPVKREEMLDYDVVILGDLNPSFLSYGVYDNLNEFVRNAGGGLVIIAGQ
ncbi:MAG: VWA domain-containing protein, partial [Planctomycetaceae bacterium]|nr:VWA domain-containing protein [Planctomycetaceae bacterium]